MHQRTTQQVQRGVTMTPKPRVMLQRKCAFGGSPGLDGECEECRQKRLSLQGQTQSFGPAARRDRSVPPIIGEVLRSPGEPLDVATRAFMEPRFGHDFSRVRVHSDSNATEAARAVNALAYTAGRNVVFGAGRYAPGTPAGRKLMAHELTHVVQQGNTSAQDIRGISQPHDKYEQEAEKMAEAVVRQDPQRTQEIANEPNGQRQSGGESEDSVYEDNDTVGGEIQNYGLEAGILQRQPAATPAAVATLTYSTKTPRTRTGDGGFQYAVQWGLNGATASTNGFIVQKLRFNLNREICSGGRNDFSKTYWEAWQVRGGNIFVGTSASPHVADTFQVPPTAGQKGVNFEEGYARYIEGYTEPSTWGRVPEARSLPATLTAPGPYEDPARQQSVAGWSDAGTLHRSVRVSFDSCNQSDLGQISGDG